MEAHERRHSQRYQMNYPVIVSSPRGIMSEDGWHLGQILDAAKNGIRLRVNNFGALPVGTLLRLICQPATADNQPDNTCMPVPIQGRVVWENPQTQEFALQYLN